MEKWVGSERAAEKPIAGGEEISVKMRDGARREEELSRKEEKMHEERGEHWRGKDE